MIDYSKRLNINLRFILNLKKFNIIERNSSPSVKLKSFINF